jgi:hypothetical protein
VKARIRASGEYEFYEDSLDAVARIPHMQYDRAQLVLFAGKREMGKTTAMRSYIETREPRVLMFDPFGDFKSLRLRVDPFVALSEMHFERGAIRRRIQPPITEESRGYATDVFAEMIDPSSDFSVRNVLLGLDEMSLWSTRNESATLATLILQGRRIGIRIIVGCQRIALVPGVMLSEMTTLILFKMTRPRDLETVAEWAGYEVAEMCPKLQIGQCLSVNL